MSEAAVNITSDPVASDRSEDRSDVHGRVRSCVGCSERVDVLDESGERNELLVRLIVSPAGEVAVDARGGGFGRGAHVHPRPDCLQRAVERGLARSAKVRVTTLATETGELVPLTREALAAAIQRAADRRIEGLLLSAKRASRLSVGADSVRSAFGRGEAYLVLVARDAAAAAELTEVREAVAAGRGVAWGDKSRLSALIHGPARTEAHRVGVGVVAISSRTLAAAVRDAVHLADGVTGLPAQKPAAARSPRASAESRRDAVAPADRAALEGSLSTSACAPAPDDGKLRPRTVTMGSSPGTQDFPSRSGSRRERGRATFTRGRRPG